MRKLGILLIIAICSLGCQKKSIKEPQGIIEEPSPIVEIPVVEEYIDDNPITVGIYMVQDRIRLLKNSYGPFSPSVDIGSYKCVYTNKEVLEDGKFKVVFQNYYNKYPDANKYSIGYHIKFALTDGTIIEKTILKPSDVRSYYGYVMSYLYDSIHQTGFYTHLSDSDLKSNTIIPSIKLTGGSQIDLVVDPISLTTFTYQDENDFDEENNYRGISSYTIQIYRK